MDLRKDCSVEDALREYLRRRVERDPNASMTPHLCHYCKAAIDGSKILGSEELELFDGLKMQEDHQHAGGIDELLQSAAEGCHLCTVLSSTLVPSMRVANSPESHEKQKLKLRINCSAREYPEQKGMQQTQTITLYRMSTTHDGETEEQLARQFVSKYDAHLRREWVDRRSIEGRARLSLWTGSEATFALAKDWLRHCLQMHSKCSKVRSYARIVPSRLLRIGDVVGDGSIYVHLVDTQTRYDNSNRSYDPTRCNTLADHDIVKRLEYVALSHRWPSKPIMKLTCTNLKRCQESIAWADLSKTFQDAIKTTRQLGIRYIWIDTLCIIQDSGEDWQKESAIMGDIYQGSVLTIACLDGKKPGEGCFQFRNPLHTYRCLLNERFFVSPTIRTQTTDWMVPSGELQTRGWVIQERALSPRTMYFGPSQIMWECCEATANEACPIGRAVSIGEECAYPSPKLSFPLLNDNASPGEELVRKESSLQLDQLQYFEHIWSELLFQYTDCDLTERDDKLVALHGIVRKIEEHCQLKPIAGLWQELLPASLLWYTALSARHQHRPHYYSNRPYRAPSWSWASTDSPILSNFNRLDAYSVNGKNGIKWCMEIKSIDVEALPNGQVCSGHLIISAPVRKINLSMLQNYQPLDDNIEYKAFNYRPFTVSSAQTASKYWNPDFGNIQDVNLYAVLAAQRDRFREPGPARLKKYGVFHDSRCNLGIIVRKRETGVFERVGYFEEHYWRSDKWPLFPMYSWRSFRTLTIV